MESQAAPARLKVLFVCDQNRLRSPTAERLYARHPGLEVRSAGLRSGASVPLSEELCGWADVIYVMERRQRNLIHKRFPRHYAGKRIVCLYVPDRFDFMQPALVELLTARLTPELGSPPHHGPDG